jgi:cell division transport system permease protein
VLAALPASAFPASLEVGFGDEVSDGELGHDGPQAARAPRRGDGGDLPERWTEKLSALLGGGVTASACLAFIVLARW